MRARCHAKRVAWRTLSESISASDARPMPQASARVVINEKSVSRSDGDTRLESSSLRNENRRGKITATPTTGPARGPRPASSSPATCGYPRARASSSRAHVGPSDPTPLASSVTVTGSRDNLQRPDQSPVSSAGAAFSTGAWTAAAATALSFECLALLAVRENSRSGTLACFPFLSRR